MKKSKYRRILAFPLTGEPRRFEHKDLGGADVGRVKTEKTGKTGKTGRPRRAGYGLVFAACAVLAGCAGQRAEDIRPKTEDRAAKQARAKVKIPDPDHFTTKGKPTKTIQTPNGPVRVYDPAKDPEVRAAFGRLYKNGTHIVNENSLRFPLSDEAVVLRARKKMYRDIVRQGCNVLMTADCNIFYHYYSPKSRDKYKACKNSNGFDCRAQSVFLNGQGDTNMCFVPSTNYFPISKDNPMKTIVPANTTYSHDLSIEEVSNWFYSFNCIDWSGHTTNPERKK